MVNITESLKTDIRNILISDIEDKIEYSFRYERIKEYEPVLRYIKEKFPDAILTGSLILYLYGLIDRSPSDIDLIITKERKDIRYLIGDYDESMKNRLGFANGYTKKFDIGESNSWIAFDFDFYLNENVNFNITNILDMGFGIHDVIDLFIIKSELAHSDNYSIATNMKNKDDIKMILDRLSI